MKLKVGDKVKIKSTSEYYKENSKSNPHCIGKVIDKSDMWIDVLWNNGEKNQYQNFDLKLYKVMKQQLKQFNVKCKTKEQTNEVTFYYDQQNGFLHWKYVFVDLNKKNNEITNIYNNPNEDFKTISFQTWKNMINNTTGGKIIIGYKLIKDLPTVKSGFVFEIKGDKIYCNKGVEQCCFFKLNKLPNLIKSGWFEPVYETTKPKITILLNLGTPERKITITKDNIISQGKQFMIHALEELLNHKYNTSVNGIDVNIITEKFQFGCKSEGSLLTRKEIETIIKKAKSLL